MADSSSTGVGVDSITFNDESGKRWREIEKEFQFAPKPDAILKRIEELIRENERLGVEIEKLRKLRAYGE